MITVTIFTFLLLLIMVILKFGVKNFLFYIFSLALFIFSFFLFGGRPIPASLLVSNSEYDVLKHYVEGNHIYMLLKPIDKGRPVLIYFPYEAKFMEELAKKENEARKLDKKLIIKPQVKELKNWFRIWDLSYPPGDLATRETIKGQ